MKESRIGKVSAKKRTSTKAAFADRSDETIRRGLNADPEVYPTDANFWKSAKVVFPDPKQTVTLRLDADLLAWLRRQKGYQTRINAVLRSYMEAHQS